MTGWSRDISLEWEWMKMDGCLPVEKFHSEPPPATWPPMSPGTLDFCNMHIQFETDKNKSPDEDFSQSFKTMWRLYTEAPNRPVLDKVFREEIEKSFFRYLTRLRQFLLVAHKLHKHGKRSQEQGGVPPIILASDVTVLVPYSSSTQQSVFADDKQHKSKTGGRPMQLITDINVLLPYSGFTQQAAAEQLNIGKSTLKRSCRILGIKEWTELKNKNVTAEAGIYNQPSLTTRPSKKSKMRNARPVIVKAKYKGDTTKVKLLSSSKKVDLDEQLARKLKIELGSFKIKHMDEDDEEILVTTDSDFEDCITNSESQGNMTIRLLVEQITV